MRKIRAVVVRLTRLTRANVGDGIVLAGILLVAHGLGQLHPALAPIFVGLAFIAAVGGSRPRQRRG